VTRIAIVATATTPPLTRYPDSEPSMIITVVNEVLGATGMARAEIDFTIAGSCDYLSGMPFAFVANVDGMGAWPPVYESHVEMDGAWALFEAWIRLQCDDGIETALVVGSGKSSPGDHRESFALQTDPYVLAPLGLDPTAAAALQAQALIAAGKATEADFAAVVHRSRTAAGQPVGSVEELLAAPYVASPLRAHDIAPVADGAAALVLATERVAAKYTDHPVWLEGMDHRIDSKHLTLRNLAECASARLAGAGAGVGAGPVDVAELHVTASSEEIVLREALGLGADTVVNPSGGPLAGDPVMATGLTRVIEAARFLRAGNGERGMAHAASGPALQQNLVAVLGVK
jgi:acetyl-CoA acetyltransferase